MTVMVTTNSQRFHGSGSTGPFTFSWRFLNNTDVSVYRIEEPDEGNPESWQPLAEGNDYTLAGAGSYTGGSLTLTEGLPVGQDLIIERNTPSLQPTDIRNQGHNFFPELHEETFDRMVMMLQDLQRGLNAVLKFPLGDPTAPELGSLEARAGNYLAFNNAGELTYLSALLSYSGEMVQNYGTLRAINTAALADKAPAIVQFRAAKGDEGGGAFYWDSADRSAEVAADPQSGIYVAPDSDPTGASGAWVRSHGNEVSLRWFGAKPNDNAYDSAPAINGCLNYFEFVENSIAASTMGGTNPDGHSPVMRGSAGAYYISSPISSTLTYVRIRGEDMIILPTASFNLSSFGVAFTQIWQADIQGIKFGGFTHHLNIENPNTNQGNIRLREVSAHGGATGIRVDCQSSKVTMESCKLTGIVNSLKVINCDLLTWRGGWLNQGTLSVDEDATIIITGGYLHMIDVLGVPKPATGSRNAWVNLHAGGFRAEGVRFGGESGAMTIVNNYSEGSDSDYNYIMLEGCKTYSSVNPVVRLFKLINEVHVTSCVGFSSNYVLEFDETYTTLDSEITRVAGRFAIWIDNTPYTRGMAISDTTQKRKLLPYFVLPDGSVDGYLTNTSAASPQAILFFGGKNSLDFMDFRDRRGYKVQLLTYTGGGDVYAEYLIKADSAGSTGNIDAILHEGTSADAPRLFLDTDNIFKVKANSTNTISCYYRITPIGLHYAP